MRRTILWVPLLIFGAFVGVFAAGLVNPSSKTIPSQMIGKPLPAFSLPRGAPGHPGVESSNFGTGKPRLLNIFASWCVPCAAEAPQLMQLAQAGVEIDAIAIRDRPEDVAGFLRRWGDPYARIGSDVESRVQIALGSAGVPETFVIDGKGVIRHQHIGEIRPEDVPGIMAAVWIVAGALIAASPALADSALPPARYADTQLPDPRQEAEATALMYTLRCLVCQGQSIADSEAEMAGDMRALVRQRIAAGEKPEAIRAWLVQRYGNWVSYDPPLDPVTWPLWALPALLLAIGAWIARGRFMRRKR